MPDGPRQLGEVLATSRNGKLELRRDGDEYVVAAPCPRCRVVQEHRTWVRDGEPSPSGISLAALILCRNCTEEDDKEELERNTAEARELRVSAAAMPHSLIKAGLKFEDMLDGADDRRASAIGVCREWASMSTPAARPGLYLWGPWGVGKTRLAATAAVARLEHSPIRWVSVALLFAKLAAAWADVDRQKALKVITGKGAVVLDDLDKVNPTENARQQLYTAINERIDAGAPMIVTANAKLSELADTLGDAIVSRLVGHCTQLELDGPDRRIKLGETA